MPSESWVSHGTRRLLAPTALANHQLSEILAGFSPGERKAFWLAVALVDGKVTTADAHGALTKGTGLKPKAGPSPKVKLPGAGPVKLIDQERTCENPECGLPLPKQFQGRPRRYHPECRTAARRHLRSVS